MQRYEEGFSAILYEATYDGLLEKISETTQNINYHGIHFAKAQPRDVMFTYPYWDERVELTNIRQLQYEADFEGMFGLTDIPRDACYKVGDCNYVIKSDYLMTLEPGYYKFDFCVEGAWSENQTARESQSIYVIIHDESEGAGNYRPCFGSYVGYYSTESQNDVLFYMNGSTSPIKTIKIDGNDLDTRYYELVCDGYGIVFHPEFLETQKENPYLKMTAYTQSGLKADFNIVFLNHAYD